MRLVAIALIALGVVGLAYGGFTYTKERHTLDLGLFDVNVDEREHVYIPAWAGAASLVVGCVLLFGRRTA